MITDDERREVARRLRSFVTDDSVYADVDACHVLYSIGLYYKDIDRIYFSGFDVARLADLIEPSGHECVPGGRPLNVRHDNDFIDRDALLALADELEEDACWEVQTHGDTSGAWRAKDTCDRIREAVGA